MSSGLLIAAYVVAWVGLRRAVPDALRVDRWVVGLWLAVAMPTLLQLTVAPGLLGWGERRGSAIGDGQVWRLVTSMFLQDGGVAGAVFNLVTLAVTALVARTVLSGPRMVGVFLVGGVVSNLLTLATFGQSGAGNSMATLFLVVVALMDVVQTDLPSVVPPLLLVVVALGLLILRDQHGLAISAGLVAGTAVAMSKRHGPLRS